MKKSGGWDQWVALKWSCDLRANERPKKNPLPMAHNHGRTHRRTDMATLWLNRPSGADSVKSQVSGVKCQVSGVNCQASGVRCPVSGVTCHMSLTVATETSERPVWRHPRARSASALKDDYYVLLSCNLYNISRLQRGHLRVRCISDVHDGALISSMFCRLG